MRFISICYFYREKSLRRNLGLLGFKTSPPGLYNYAFSSFIFLPSILKSDKITAKYFPSYTSLHLILFEVTLLFPSFSYTIVLTSSDYNINAI